MSLVWNSHREEASNEYFEQLEYFSPLSINAHGWSGWNNSKICNMRLNWKFIWYSFSCIQSPQCNVVRPRWIVVCLSCVGTLNICSNTRLWSNWFIAVALLKCLMLNLYGIIIIMRAPKGSYHHKSWRDIFRIEDLVLRLLSSKNEKKKYYFYSGYG